jgi:hypothetical protein
MNAEPRDCPRLCLATGRRRALRATTASRTDRRPEVRLEQRPVRFGCAPPKPLRMTAAGRRTSGARADRPPGRSGQMRAMLLGRARGAILRGGGAELTAAPEHKPAQVSCTRGVGAIRVAPTPRGPALRLTTGLAAGIRRRMGGSVSTAGPNLTAATSSGCASSAAVLRSRPSSSPGASGDGRAAVAT